MEMDKKLSNSKKFGISFKVEKNLEKYIFGDTVDELIDDLALLKDAGFINYFIRIFENLTEEQLARLDDIMLTTDNSGQIVFYARKRKNKINTQKYQNRLIELRNMYQLVNFAVFALQPDIEKIEDAVIAYGNAQNAVELLEKVKDVNVEKMKNFILEKQELEQVCDLVRMLIHRNHIINQNDLLRAKQIVINSRDMWTIRYWASSIGNVSEMEDVTVQYGDGWQIYHFAEQVKNANIEKIRKAMKQRNDIPKEIKDEFDLRFPNPTIKEKFLNWVKKKR